MIGGEKNKKLGADKKVYEYDKGIGKEWIWEVKKEL